MTEEEKLLINRFHDLDGRANSKYMVCYTDFLNATEYSIFLEHEGEFLCSTQVFAEIEDLERQMIAFIPDALNFNMEYPIKLIRFRAKNKKFAQELTHRDILGTLMGLSIERRLIGDIITCEEACYVLVKEQFADLICNEIHRIKHTEVVAQICDSFEVEVKRKFNTKYGTVASKRLDCIISELTNESRSQSLKQIKEGLVFVNSRQTKYNTYSCKDGDIISVRHVGKFKIQEFGEVNKRGRIRICYDIYC